MAMHRACGGEVHLLTLTVPHTRFDALEGLLERQGKALQGFLRDRKVKEVFKEMGYIGQIRGYETTHGRKGTNNGWHPHFHFLQFVMVKGDAAQLMDWKTRLYLRWDAYCQKAGLGSPSFQHGIDLRDGSFANNYVAKWGLEDEMTKGHIKKGKAGGETPFDLLRAVLADKEDKQAAALFAEFAKAFKGKRQLSWSNGLKAKFNLVEKNDEELAAELEDNAELLGLISPDEWRDVLKVKARATVLELAAAAGWPAVKKFLAFIDGCRDGVYEVRPGHGGRGSNADFGGDDVSNKKLRNVRFEVPQMSEKWGFRWCLRRWRMRNRLPKNLARMQFGRLGDCSACRLAISGRTSPANGSRFPRISGVLSTQTVSLHKCALPRSANDFAKQSLSEYTLRLFGGIGGLPDVP